MAGQAYFKTRERKFDQNGAVTLTQNRYQVYDDTKQAAEAEAAFNALTTEQKEAATSTNVPAVPLNFIGWQIRPANINVIASGNDADYAQIAGNYGTQTLTISPRAGVAGSPYQVKVLRNKKSYPTGATGFASFRAAVEAGFFDLTVVGTGQTIVSGTVPPTSVTTTTTPPPSTGNPGASISTAPDWMKGLRYSYDGTKLRFESTGGIGSLSFDTYPVTSWAINNPSGVLIENGKDYGPGSISGGGIWVDQWEINHQPAEFTIRAKKKNDASTSFLYALTPTAGASNVVLVQPNSTTTTNTNATTLSALTANIVAIGNSITKTNFVGLDNQTHNWGMAATTEANDYIHQLRSKALAVNAQAQVRSLPELGFIPVPHSTVQGQENALSYADGADGSYFEDNYYRYDQNPYGFLRYGGLDRFAPLATYSSPQNNYVGPPSVLIIRLGENTKPADHALDDTSSLGLRAQMKALIKKIMPAGSTGKTIVTSAVWDRPDYNAIAQAVCQDEGYTYVDVSGIAGRTAGAGAHPDDSCMAEIANRIWNAIVSLASTTNTGTGGGGTDGSQGGSGDYSGQYNKPTFETFAYAVPAANYQTNWPEYDNRIRMGRAIGEKIVLQNSYVRAEIWKNYGCSVAHLSVPGEQNLINQSDDLGRGVGLTDYRGGRTRQQEGTGKRLATNWASEEGGGVGNDPIQIGDTWNYPSQVLDMRRTDTMVYTKIQKMNWAVENEVTDVILEQWMYLHERSIHVYHRTTCNRPDHTKYEARPNEYPCFYAIGDYRYLGFADGNGNVQFKTASPNQTTFTIGEPWNSFTKNPSTNEVGAGMGRSGYYTSNQYNQAGGAGGDEFSSGASYTSADQHLQFDWNGVYYGHYYLMVGTVDQMRSYALAQADPWNRLSWKFNSRNGRGRFWYHNGEDAGYPTAEDGLRFYPQIQGNCDFNWPDVGIVPATAQNLYVRYKAASSFTNSVSFFYAKTGQIDQNLAHQAMNLSLTCDNGWHTLVIPVSTMSNDYNINIDGQEIHQTGAWNDSRKVARLQLQFHNATPNTFIQIAWINTADTDPEP